MKVLLREWGNTGAPASASVTLSTTLEVAGEMIRRNQQMGRTVKVDHLVTSWRGRQIGRFHPGPHSSEWVSYLSLDTQEKEIT